MTVLKTDAFKNCLIRQFIEAAEEQGLHFEWILVTCKAGAKRNERGVGWSNAEKNYAHLHIQLQPLIPQDAPQIDSERRRGGANKGIPFLKFKTVKSVRVSNRKNAPRIELVYGGFLA